MTLGTAERPVKVLIVEDNPGDAELTQRTLGQSEYHYDVSVLEDGEAAMDYLRGAGLEAATALPDLVVLDLGLPKKDGREVLAEMGADPALKDIPVIILTVTRAERPLIRELGIHPSRYCSKPLELVRFRGIMRDIVGS